MLKMPVFLCSRILYKFISLCSLDVYGFYNFSSRMKAGWHRELLRKECTQTREVVGKDFASDEPRLEDSFPTYVGKEVCLTTY